MSHGWLRRLKSSGLGLAFAFGLLTAGFLQLPYQSTAQQQAIGAAAPAAPGNLPAGSSSLIDMSEAFASIAEHIKPSVVYIKSGRKPETARNPQARPRMQVPPGFEEFFRNFPPMQQEPRFQEGSGSGFIVSKDGYILTNNHVVEGSDQVTVRLLDRREFKAKIVGTDPNTDLAVLKIEAKNLAAAPLGNSSASRVGEWVLAVGNPLGDNLTFTVTSGIISAKGRSLALAGSERSQYSGLHSDRCGHQSRQLRWATRQRARRSDRRQLSYRQPDGVLLGLRLCHPHRSGPPGDGSDHCRRSCQPSRHGGERSERHCERRGIRRAS